MKLLKRGIEIILVLSLLGLILYEGSLPEHINEHGSILTEENAIDLGNHIVAYLISGRTTGYLEGKWIVICDIEEENSFFIPNVEGRGDTDDCYEEISVPLFFADKECDYIEIYSPYSPKRKTIVESRMNTGNLPESIW